MKPDEIERLARDHKTLPNSVALPDSCYYWTMRALWDGVRSGRVDRVHAGAQKKLLLRQYMEFRAAYDSVCDGYRWQQDNIRRASTLRNCVMKTNDIREKLRLAVQCIGAMTGDRVFEKTELRKLEATERDDVS